MEEHDNISEKKAGSKNFNKPYTEDGIQHLRNIVQDFQDQGIQKDYSILVDGEAVVGRNSDSSNFDKYKRYMSSHTQSIEVRMYFGNSPNFNRHVFHTNYNALNGPETRDVEQRIKEALERQRMLSEIRLLKGQLKRKNKKLKQFKALQAELDDKQMSIKDVITQGVQLWGQFRGGNNTSPVQQVHGAPEGQNAEEITVEPAQEESQSEQFFNQMKEQHSEEELQRSLKTWMIFTRNPDLQQVINEFLINKSQKNGNTQVHPDSQRKKTRRSKKSKRSGATSEHNPNDNS